MVEKINVFVYQTCMQVATIEVSLLYTNVKDTITQY